jgi:hypothetical protein
MACTQSIEGPGGWTKERAKISKYDKVSGSAGHRLFGVLVSTVIGATAGGRLLTGRPTYAPLLPFGITLAVVAIAVTALAH